MADALAPILDRLAKSDAFAWGPKIERAEIDALETDLGVPFPREWRALVTMRGTCRFPKHDQGMPQLLDAEGIRQKTTQIRAACAARPNAKRLGPSLVVFAADSGRYPFFLAFASDGTIRRCSGSRPDWASKVHSRSLVEYLAVVADEIAPARGAAAYATTRKLAFEEPEDGFPDDLGRYTKLEELAIDLTNYPKDVDVLRRLPLRVLRIGFLESKTIPLPLFCDLLSLPNLEELGLGFTRLPKGCGATFIDPLLRGLAAAKAAPEVRRLHARLLLGSVDEIVKSRTEQSALLFALDSNVAPVRSASLSVLARIVPKPTLARGAEVLSVGGLNLDRDVVAERLAAEGITLVRKASKKTTHVLVGEKPGGKWREPLERGAALLLEEHLPKDGFLIAEAKRDDGLTRARIAELLASEDAANISLALEMMKTGGVPAGVFEELFLTYQRTSFDAKLRAAAKKLFFAHAPIELRLAIEKNLRGTSIYFSGDTKTKTRIKTLVRDSKGKLDGPKLALLVGCLNYIFDEVKDPELHLRALEAKRTGDTLDLISRELRSLPPAFAKLEGIKKLGLAANHFAEIPDVVFTLTSIRELDVSSNQLKDLPRSLTKLEALDALIAGSNRLEKFPLVVFELRGLRRLDLSTELWGLHMPFTSLPARIAELDRLEELALRAHTFKTLPRELLALPKLAKLDLSSAEIKELPEWLADLPSLEELDVRLTRTKAHALDRLAAKLMPRGVAVLR